MISQETIQEAVRRLVKAYDPLSIYLFGRYAWGTPDDDDDLNLLVIVESSDVVAYRRGDLAFDALFGLKIPTNVAVLTKQEFEVSLQDITSLGYEVKTRGKMLYAPAYAQEPFDEGSGLKASPLIPRSSVAAFRGTADRQGLRIG